MDDLINTNVDVGGAVTNIASGFGEVVVWLLVISLIAGLLFAGWYLLSFKHKVRIRKVNSDGRSLIIDDRARKIVDKQGVVWWKLQRLNQKVAEPPSEVQEISRRGKIVVEGYLFDGKFFWKSNTFDKKVFTDKDAEFIEGGFDAISSGERSLYISELEQSYAYKKKKLIDLLWTATPIIGIIIMLTLFFIFFDNVITPGYEIAEQNRLMVEAHAKTSENVYQAMSIIEDLVLNRETLSIDQSSPPD